jgi:uncharacterized membrane protein
MENDDTEINWVGVGITVLVFFVIPLLSLLRGGEAPLYAFEVMLIVGTFILIFKRDWWWRPLRIYLTQKETQRSE